MAESTRTQAAFEELKDIIEKRILKLGESLQKSLAESLQQTLTESMKELFRNHIEDVQQASGTRGSGEKFISNPSYPCHTRLTSINLPKFSGENVKEWIYQCEIYFTIDDTPLDLKTKLAIMHLEGSALKWYHALHRNHRVFPDWFEFTRALTERFGEVCGPAPRPQVTTPTESFKPTYNQTHTAAISRQATSSAFTKSEILVNNKYLEQILGEEIGKGAYGQDFKGLDLEEGHLVVMKQVSLKNIAEEDLNISMRDVDLLKNLNHKNIVRCLGSLKIKSHLYIISEYVENGSLANIIKPNKFGPFPESLVAVYIAQVLEGLVYLHEQGVIHRDIKGANILTTKEGLVKLADFGVPTKLTKVDVNDQSAVCSIYWMAPEIIETSRVCAASDIWSVGCTVIELLTCVPPYYDLHPLRALFHIVKNERPPIPDNLSPDITDFLHQCFQKDAKQRPDAKTVEHSSK